MALRWHLAHNTSIQRLGFSINVSVREATLLPEKLPSEETYNCQVSKIIMLMIDEQWHSIGIWPTRLAYRGWALA